MHIIVDGTRAVNESDRRLSAKTGAINDKGFS